MMFLYGLYAPLLGRPGVTRTRLAYMSTLPPEMRAWAERKGIADSRRAIARAAGIGTSTVSRLIDSGNTSYETVAKVAAALGVDTDDVFRVSGLSDGTQKPWQPPLKESFLLSEPARRALDALIRAMVENNEPAEAAEPDPDGRPDLISELEGSNEQSNEEARRADNAVARDERDSSTGDSKPLPRDTGRN